MGSRFTETLVFGRYSIAKLGLTRDSNPETLAPKARIYQTRVLSHLIALSMNYNIEAFERDHCLTETLVSQRYLLTKLGLVRDFLPTVQNSFDPFQLCVYN